jgi:hydrogenase maturation protein HypF
MHRRLRIAIQGAVQGVGFRPFVFRLAEELALRGFVQNDSRGVLIELEGEPEALTRFLDRLPSEKPAHALLHSVESHWLEPAGFDCFEIRHSEDQGERVAAVLPDLATCEDCRRDVGDPSDRRHGYPFTNCTNCGPRFTILRALPYDRPNTTMSRFAMCARCRAEYEDPRDRRFHAQPTACPECGPRLALWNARGDSLATAGEALRMGAAALREGRIVALKGLGGFHLLADARSAETVRTLRARKARWGKPLALMVRDLEAVRALCEVSDRAAALLASAQAPIVLLPRRPGAVVAPEVAPETPYLGVMLPYTPLHHLLFTHVEFPLVATSGNLSEEPICIDEHEALGRLGKIADLFLVHDRPIERHVDDSVVFLVREEPRLLRRARGYAPLPVRVGRELPPILAVGAHQKVTIALAAGRQVFLSQHIGDLETPAAFAAFERVIADFLRLYGVEPVAIAHDLHPDFTSTRWARENARGKLVPVQHHHAHLASCLAENEAAGPALGVTWDGTGLGTDGTIWGGEFLLGDAAGFERSASLRPFRLPGGEAAVREPRRVALALLWEMEGPRALERDDLAPIRDLAAGERRVLGRMLEHSLNAPVTTSAGRLFDGVAALLGLHPRVTFEGQAAMALEHLADPHEPGAYPLPLSSSPGAIAILDWAPLVEALLADLRRGEAREAMAARFHNGLVEAIVAVARRVGERRVALTGGCFQNRLLAERAAERLERAGFEVLLHRQVPPNDGGVSLGQALVAAASL